VQKITAEQSKNQN